jgi:hypothetical protein
VRICEKGTKLYRAHRAFGDLLIGGRFTLFNKDNFFNYYHLSTVVRDLPIVQHGKKRKGSHSFQFC